MRTSFDEPKSEKPTAEELLAEVEKLRARWRAEGVTREQHLQRLGEMLGIPPEQRGGDNGVQHQPRTSP